MTYEWTYMVIERREGGWAGNYGHTPQKGPKGQGGDGPTVKAGQASPGRITGGVVNAETEEEAKMQIKELHGLDCEFMSLDKRQAVNVNL